MAWYRDTRYQASTCSTGTVRARSRKPKAEMTGIVLNEKKPKKKGFRRPNESESFEILNRNPDRPSMEDNIISNQCFLRRFVSEALFGNTDDFFSSDRELVLSSSVIQLRGGITWLTHVPHARVHDWPLFLHGCVAISCRSWSDGGRCKA